MLTKLEPVAAAFERARGGAWAPKDLQARWHATELALATVDCQQERLLQAYLNSVLDVATSGRKRQEFDLRRDTLRQQLHQLDAIAQK